ncbi:hypothetical protein PIROE2DRAFT_9507 [Piromyces sp. E2]|nr:hypothetical protein PIROE2DRAFT_9507 [Piromyces sp. E2]|eukprot:OUM63900.1 hypothetical protein PIROE2DRAFT_9507 [Piromyces sp. E2]
MDSPNTTTLDKSRTGSMSYDNINTTNNNSGNNKKRNSQNQNQNQSHQSHSQNRINEKSITNDHKTIPSKNRYEENEEWLLKNTDKLLRNLFDRQKKWENTRVC